MTIKQLMNIMIDTSTELLEASIDDQDIIPYYIGKLDGQIQILKKVLTDKELMAEEI